MIAVSGPLDFVTDGTRNWRIANADPMLTRVAGGGGDTLAAMMSAFAAVDENQLATTMAAITVRADHAARTHRHRTNRHRTNRPAHTPAPRRPGQRSHPRRLPCLSGPANRHVTGRAPILDDRSTFLLR
ncbi:hydroxyethylthiazole kinase [Streptomyces sp. KK5PA1]|uniref:hydroxyethylthiazole kinase n=1 Tax=Actinacidiphila acididurans TaxID=2784346 RepID=A0ABS2TIC5_9ACTN|nr:hydroxyethylthiazole kinase [Actinacidiphila acididurans]